MKILFLLFIVTVHQSEACFSKLGEWLKPWFETPQSNVTLTSSTAKPSFDCGVPYFEPNIMRIYGGYEAAMYSWPYIVSIGVSGPKQTMDHICGGVLISDEYVLTAAHCVDRDEIFSAFGKPPSGNLEDMMRLYIGIHDRSKDISNQTTFYASKIIPHELYNSVILKNDLALIKLRTKIKKLPNVRWICLSKEIKAEHGDNLIIAGWGYTEKSLKIPNKLMQVSIPVNTPTNCALKYDLTTQFCAGDTKTLKDSCAGDSGGPVMKFNNGKWSVVGIVSYGVNDCSGTGVYTNTSVFYEWIMTKKDEIFF